MQGTIYSKKKNESFQEGKDHKTRKASKRTGTECDRAGRSTSVRQFWVTKL